MSNYNASASAQAFIPNGKSAVELESWQSGPLCVSASTLPAFRFIPYPNDDIGQALHMPSFPPGMSDRMTALVEGYTHAVLNAVSDEVVHKTMAAIAETTAQSPADEAAKHIVLLHAQHAGADSEAGKLVLIDNFSSPACRAIAESTIAGLLIVARENLQACWAEAFSSYEQALRTELDYDRTTYSPQWEAYQAGLGDCPQAVCDEYERLGDLRGDLEDVLMQIPCMAGEHLAIKLLISRDGGRELNAFDDIMLEDARRLSGWSMLS
jgi:hypothetical protein